MSQSSGDFHTSRQTLIKPRRHARLHEVEAGFLFVEFAGAESRKPRNSVAWQECMRCLGQCQAGGLLTGSIGLIWPIGPISPNRPSQPRDNSYHPKHSSSVEGPRQTSRQHRPSHSSKPQKTGCFRTLLISRGLRGTWRSVFLLPVRTAV